MNLNMFKTDILCCFSEYQLNFSLFQSVYIFMPHSSLHFTACRLDSPLFQLSRHTDVVVMSRDEILLKLRLSGFKITCRGPRSSALRARDPKCWPECSGLAGGITAFLSKQQSQVWSWIRMSWELIRDKRCSSGFSFSIPNHFLLISSMISSTSAPKTIFWIQ